MATPGPAPTNTPDEPLELADLEAWEAWLAEHHDRSGGVWLAIAKTGRAGLHIADALDGALCFGWIDGQRKGLDDDRFRQRYSPRRPASSWSQVNVAKVDVLLAAGRVREPGHAAIAAAKADGRWDAAYEPQRTATTPPDLEAALAADPRARAAFDALARSDRYVLLLRLMKARTPAARATQVRGILKTLGSQPEG